MARLSIQQSLASVNDVNKDGLLNNGDSLTFAFLIVNTGDVAISRVSVVDARLQALNVRISCSATTLAPGASTRCVSGPAFITPFQAKPPNSFGTNYAYAQGLTGSGSTVHSNSSQVTQGAVVPGASPAPVLPTPPAAPTPKVPTPGHSVHSVRSGPKLSVQQYRASVVDANKDGLMNNGDSLTFGFLISNTGDLTVSGISVVDPRLEVLQAPISCGTTTLAPGASTRCVSGLVFITPFQAKLPNSFGTNYGYARGVATSGVTVQSNGSQVTQGAAVTAVSESSTMAMTGEDLGGPVWGGIGLLGLGTLLLLAAGTRRRRQVNVLL